MPWKLASLGSLLAVAMLAGCSSTPSTKSAADTVATTDTGHSRCDAKAAEFTIGKQASAELLEQARTRSGAQNARFLLPTDMVTLEYRSDRLNLNTDASRVVTRVNCG
ncbi:I78 family peptidase inhibitor [Pseudomonas vancouverensis]|uniref:I78 family peptidase inhibitor n=1 Tax=Pseudomonas vancouverensis TaxID=95300 RepID=UPI003CFCBCDE